MLIPPAYAQAAATAPSGTTGFLLQFAPLLLIFIIFWFLLIRPQQAKLKAHRAMLDSVKKGDSVVTGGGFLGKITRVDGDTVEIELAPNLRVKALKATLTDVTGAGRPAND